MSISRLFGEHNDSFITADTVFDAAYEVVDCNAKKSVPDQEDTLSQAMARTLIDGLISRAMPYRFILSAAQEPGRTTPKRRGLHLVQPAEDALRFQGEVFSFANQDAAFTLVGVSGYDSKGKYFMADELIYPSAQSPTVQSIARVSLETTDYYMAIDPTYSAGFLGRVYEQLQRVIEHDPRPAEPDTTDAIVLRPKFGRADSAQ